MRLAIPSYFRSVTEFFVWTDNVVESEPAEQGMTHSDTLFSALVLINSAY